MNPGDRLAHDTRLDREVALKLLPDDFSADPDRVARFRREAKLLAALNHPNVAHIHGLEEDQGRLCLAMEQAPGETLAAPIERGPMPVDEVLDLGVQMTAGLEEAQENGIVHRDLKPANVKLGPEGKLKILDFGLARAYLGDDDGLANSDDSPTMTAAMTQAGVILWELLCGRRLFGGETVSDTLAKADLVFGLNRMWEVHVEGQWEAKVLVFRSRAEALEWLTA